MPVTPSFAMRRLADTILTRLHPLIQLRWIAVTGQVATILCVQFLLGIKLPVIPMLMIAIFLATFNLFSMFWWHHREDVSNKVLFFSLLVDVFTLTAQLHFSGGIANPFTFLFLVQIALAAILLKPLASWGIAVITTLCFIALIFFRGPVDIPERYHVTGLLICFFLDGVLLVFFINRINAILRSRNQHLASMRQQAAEEEHIVRMGLLASGAAHELGTPLATISVLLNDWQRTPGFKQDPTLLEDAAEMQIQIDRCKSIVSGILMSSGTMRATAPQQNDLKNFFDTLINHWQNTRHVQQFEYRNLLENSFPIVSDEGLKQTITNILDNALEASPLWLALEVLQHEDNLIIRVLDNGPGFSPKMLNQFGRPYQSTKGRSGSGLGLFLSSNVVKSLGGNIYPQNREHKGAIVTMTLPLGSLRLKESTND